ncbi:MAG: response regulator, partial [Spirochaetales bacterium]|nr:response regulator [Spirochaetales bacterium]
EEPDFAFLDLTMPVMDGFDALVQIQKDFSDPIVIILTADIQTGSVAKCMEYGAYTVIKKLPKKDIVFKLLDDIYEEIGVN